MCSQYFNFAPIFSQNAPKFCILRKIFRQEQNYFENLPTAQNLGGRAIVHPAVTILRTCYVELFDVRRKVPVLQGPEKVLFA